MLVVAAVVMILSLAAMNQLDSALRRMHLPGEPSGGVTSIAAPLAKGDGIEKVINGWRAWDVSQRNNSDFEVDFYADPTDVLSSAASRWVPWLAIDSVLFAPSLMIFIVGLSWRRHRRFEEHGFPNGSPGSGMRRALRMAAMWGGPAYLAVDLFENAITFVLLRGEPIDILDDLILVVLGPVSLFKVVLVASVVAAALGSFAFRAAPEPIRRSHTQTLLTLRVPVAIAALTFAILSQLPSNVRDQLADVVRQWHERPVGFAIAFGVNPVLVRRPHRDR